MCRLSSFKLKMMTRGLKVHNLSIFISFANLHICTFAHWLSSLTYWKNQIVVRRESIIDHKFSITKFFGWSEVSGRVTNYNSKTSFNFFKATKGTWWMPWLWEAMKDVVSCDKLRGAAHKRNIRRFPNGTTQHTEGMLLRKESQPRELKHLSTGRKRKQLWFPE